MSKVKELLASSKHIIAVAGAGLSAASGIPTFRGAGGLWRQFDAISLATPEAFEENPSRVWQFYHYRREKAREATPNAAHRTLARLAVPALRAQIAPRATFTLITQNVDGLSRRALDAVVAEYNANTDAPYTPFIPEPEPDEDSDGTDDPTEPALLEMHGRLFDVVCTSPSCGHREHNSASPIVPALRGTERLTGALAAGSEPVIPRSKLPRCARCGALARPGVVWFGEVPWFLGRIDRLVRKADVCIVVGTSSTVYPAAGYAQEVQEHGGKVAVFNLERSAGDVGADFLFLGPCEELLSEALGGL